MRALAEGAEAIVFEIKEPLRVVERLRPPDRGDGLDARKHRQVVAQRFGDALASASRRCVPPARRFPCCQQSREHHRWRGSRRKSTPQTGHRTNSGTFRFAGAGNALKGRRPARRRHARGPLANPVRRSRPTEWRLPPAYRGRPSQPEVPTEGRTSRAWAFPRGWASAFTVTPAR
jgi:hypothetical protein